MYRKNVLLLRRNLQLLVKLRLVLNSIIRQSGIHIQDFSLSFPSITFCMNVDLLVSVKNFPNGLFFRNLKLIFSIAQSIDDSDELTFLCEFSNEKLLILPPRNGQRIANQLKMKVSSLRDIELFLSLSIDESSRLLCLFIKPTRDISSRCLDDGVYFWKMPILLNQLREIVDIIEKRNPDIVGCVMRLQFRENVVPAFMVGLG